MLRVGAEQIVEQSLSTAATLKFIMLLTEPSMSASRRNVIRVH